MAIPQSQNTDLRSCLEVYIKGLSELSPPVIVDFAFDSYTAPDNTDDNPADTEYTTVTGTVTDIRSAVISGTTYYYIELDDSGLYYYVAAGVTNKVMLLSVGDVITVTTADSSAADLAPAASVEKSATAAVPETETEAETEAETESESETAAQN